MRTSTDAQVDPWDDFEHESRELESIQEKIAASDSVDPALREQQKALQLRHKSAFARLPFLDKIYARLPLEVRKIIWWYYYLYADPVVLPANEPLSRGPLVSEDPESEAAQPLPPRKELDPFLNQPKLSVASLGPRVCDEMREAWLKGTTVIIRDSRHLKSFLNAALPSGKQFKVVVKHLRIFIRIEDFAETVIGSEVYYSEEEYHADENSTRWKSREKRVYEDYYKTLACLNEILWKPGMQLEFCILHRMFDDAYQYVRVSRVFDNMLEVIKPVYFKAKQAGAGVAVRSEEHGIKTVSDMSLLIEDDEQGWNQRQEQAFWISGEDKPWCWIAKGDAASRRSRDRVRLPPDEPSWQPDIGTNFWKHFR